MDEEDYGTNVDDAVWVRKEQIIPMLENISVPYHRALFALLFVTGARISEVTALKRYDITLDYEHDSIEILLPNLKQRGRKAIKGRLPLKYVRSAPKKTAIIDLKQDLDISHFFLEYVEDMPDNKLLFESSTLEGEPISIQWAIQLSKKYFSKIYDGKMRTHKLGRHSYVMNSAERGMSFMDVKEQTGWKKVDSGSNYLHRFGLKGRLERLQALRKNHNGHPA